MSAKRKSYSLEVKLAAIEMAKKTDNVKAAARFLTDESSIRKWRLKELELKESKKKHGGTGKRLKVAGRHVKHKEFDDKLAGWVRELRGKKLRVSRKMVQIEARKLLEKHPAEDEGGKPLTASIGWVRKFMARHGFTLRRRTTTCQKAPEHYKEKVVRFIRYVEELRKAQNFAFVYAADETAIAMDGNGGLTIEEKGAKEVPILSTGHEKTNVTVMLTAASDGTPLKPFVLLKLKRPIKKIEDQFRSSLNLCWEGTNWMNNQIVERYLRATFKDPGFVRGKRLLVWDSFSAHISADTKKVLRSLQMHTAVVPGGCTKWLQAPDVSWNAPFKAKLRELYDNWMVHGDRQETAGGNPKPPPHEVYLQWIVDAWKNIPQARILDGAAFEEALILDDEDAALLDVSDVDDGEGSDSDASIESESSTEAGPSQEDTSRTRASMASCCTYAPDCQCELCDDDF